jgi:hypothetical protein
MSPSDASRQGDALSIMLRSPGNWVRIAALVLAFAATLTQAVEVHPDIDFIFDMPLAPLLKLNGADLSLIATVFPILIAAGLVTSLVPAARSYLRLVDLLAALSGGAIILLVLAAFVTLDQQFGTIRDYSQIPNVMRHIDNGFQPTLAVFAVAGATALMVAIMLIPALSPPVRGVAR